MKRYEIPSMEIIVFMNRDVVTSSDLNGVGNGDGNGKPLDQLFPGITF